MGLFLKEAGMGQSTDSECADPKEVSPRGARAVPLASAGLQGQNVMALLIIMV